MAFQVGARLLLVRRPPRRAPGRTTGWDGVRNFQARNFLRDSIQVGDQASSIIIPAANPPAIAGIAEVVEAGHPDPTAFDPGCDHYDPKSKPDDPTWFQVSIRAVAPVDPPLSLTDLRQLPELEGMELLRRGSRLSIQPVQAGEWAAILALAGAATTSPSTE